MPTSKERREHEGKIPGAGLHAPVPSSHEVAEHEGRVPQPSIPTGVRNAPSVTVPYAPTATGRAAANLHQYKAKALKQVAEANFDTDQHGHVKTSTVKIPAIKTSPVSIAKANADLKSTLHLAKTHGATAKELNEARSVGSARIIHENYELDKKGHIKLETVKVPKLKVSHKKLRAELSRVNKESKLEAESAAIKGASGFHFNAEHGHILGSLIGAADINPVRLAHIESTPQGKVGRTLALAKEKAHEHSEPSTLQTLSIASLGVPGLGAEGLLAKGAETGAELVPRLLAEGGVREVGSAAGARIAAGAGAKLAATKAAGIALLHSPEDIAQALRELPAALRTSPGALKEALARLPGKVRLTPLAAQRLAIRGGEKSLNSVAVLGLGEVTNKAGVKIPILDAVPALAEGTAKALEENPRKTISTTARALPGLVVAPAALGEAGVESILHGTPDPAINTVDSIFKGTKGIAEKLFSGNSKEVQKSIENEVGLTPYIPIPAVLHHIHTSDLYTEGIRSPLRAVVEDRRAVRREKSVEAHKSDGISVPKELGKLALRKEKAKLKGSVNVPGTDEHYILREVGKLIGNRRDRAMRALDATRYSTFAKEWNALETKRLRRVARGRAPGGKGALDALRGRLTGKSKGLGLSPKAGEMGRSYEALVPVMAKYGIPHSEAGLERLKELQNYYGAPTGEHLPDTAITDRIATHNAAENHPEIVNDARHQNLTDEFRAGQRRLAEELPNSYATKPFRIQNDFTNHLREAASNPKILKDYERISDAAHEFTSPKEAARGLANLAQAKLESARDLKKAGADPKKIAAAEDDALHLYVAAREQSKGYGLDGKHVSREGAWAHYESLKHDEVIVRREAKTWGQSDEGKTLYELAEEIKIQRQALHKEIKKFVREPTKIDTSSKAASDAKLKEDFISEQSKANEEQGLLEPVHVHDEIPISVPGATYGVKGTVPGKVQHFSQGKIARSGDADAIFEHVLHNSSIHPRSQIAINDFIQQSLNDLKTPVRMKDGTYKHVVTNDERIYANNAHTTPEGTEWFPATLLKAALKGGRPMSAGDALKLIDEVRGAGTEEGLAALAEKYPDIRSEILDTKGRTYAAVREAGMDELVHQLEGIKHTKLHALANAPTRLLLNDPAWVFAQLFATGIPILASLGPSALLHAPQAIKAMADIQKMDPASRARVMAMIGSSTGILGSPHPAFANSDPYATARAIRKSGAGHRAWNLARGHTMGAWDRWNAAKMREFAAAVRSSKDFRNWHRGFEGLDKNMRDISEATKGLSSAQRLEYISKHPKMAQAVQTHLNEIGGNWNSFTHMERKVAPFLVFYPWMRYSLKWVFHTFPVNHPVTATALSFLAQRNANELQLLAANSAKEAGVKGITPTTSLDEVFDYANPVHRNAEDEPVENPKGIRFAPGLGVAGNVILKGDLLQSLSGLNPWLNTGISLATNRNTFTGEELHGTTLENLGEQVLGLSPVVRLGEAATGFRGFDSKPQSATSKAYEILAGGKRTKAKRSFLNPYLTRPSSDGGLENALNTVENRIGQTGHDKQSEVQGDDSLTVRDRQKQVAELKKVNKAAWAEKEKLLRKIGGPELARQSREEYERYTVSGEELKKKTPSGALGLESKSSGLSLEPATGTGLGIPTLKNSKAYEYRPPNEELHVPGSVKHALSSALGEASSLIGGTKAEAADLKKSLPKIKPQHQVQTNLNEAAKKIDTGPAANEIISSKPSKPHPSNVKVASHLNAWGLDPDKVASLVKAANKYGVPPQLLASISKYESGNGTSTLPGVHSGSNEAGAAGPFQMGNETGAAGNSWQTNAAEIWGNKADQHSVYNYDDAAMAAAHYLQKAGVTNDPSTWNAGALSYNHAQWYADEVVGSAKEASRLPWGSASSKPQIQTIKVKQDVKSMLGWARATVGTEEGSKLQAKWASESGISSGTAWCSAWLAAGLARLGLPAPNNPAYSNTWSEGWKGGTTLPPDISKVQPGDILEFSGQHVGMYVGNGEMISGNFSDSVMRAPISEESAPLSNIVRPHYSGKWTHIKEMPFNGAVSGGEFSGEVGVAAGAPAGGSAYKPGREAEEEKEITEIGRNIKGGLGGSSSGSVGQPYLDTTGAGTFLTNSEAAKIGAGSTREGEAVVDALKKALVTREINKTSTHKLPKFDLKPSKL